MDPHQAHLNAMYHHNYQFYHNHNHNPHPNNCQNQTAEFTENRNCFQQKQKQKQEANTDTVAMDIDVSASESDTNHTTIMNVNVKNSNKRNKHRKHWILQSGYKLHGTHNKTKYRILKCIGKGRFSHVFSAFDECKRDNIAIKVDTNPKEKELLLFEYEIMKSFANLSPYICKAYDFGKLPKDIGIGNYLCMELCHEKNLSDQRKECPSKCFGIQKGALIGVEMLLSLREFHKKGYVHRDIKPSNFVLPLTTYWKHHVYIVDFGLSKKFNYKTCKMQKEAEFIGTSLYASITAHNKLDLSPIDDLWSLAFVIIDISTNALPWKPLYVQLENQSKLRRTEVGKLKHNFIQQMSMNHNNNTSSSYKMPKEYKEFICTLNKTKYNEVPKYNQLIHILRSIAANDEYKEEQYAADHAPLIIDRPIYTNFDILNDKLCFDKLQLNFNSILCKEFIENNNNYCSSNRARGSWCNLGYHWTLNDEMHFRNTHELPQTHIVTHNICSSVMQFMECKHHKCDKQHPKYGIEYVWNETKTFSKNKIIWGQEDVSDFVEFGLFPHGINYARNIINADNFKQYLNPFVKYKLDHLMNHSNAVFSDNDFAHDAILNVWFQLNVSQSIAILKDLSSYNNEQKREFILHSMKNALHEYQAPPQCTKAHRSIASLQYPALYALCQKGNFNFDDRNVTDVILDRLEEFVRHSRGKHIGNVNEIMDILMEIPPKYAIDVLDEIQNMGLQKISVVQSAIKRACDQKRDWIERLQLKQNQPKFVTANPCFVADTVPVTAAAATTAAAAVPVADIVHIPSNTIITTPSINKVKCTKSVKSVKLESKTTSIGNLGYLDHLISDTKPQTTTNYNSQQRNKFNYSQRRSNNNSNSHKAISKYAFNNDNNEKHPFRIPKKRHLINNNNITKDSHRSVAKHIAKKVIKKTKEKTSAKKQENCKTKKKKHRNKLKKKPIKPVVNNTNAMIQDINYENDDDEILNIKNHRKRKRAIDDSSDEDEDEEDESSDSDDDIPIGRKRKRRRHQHKNEEEPNTKKRKYVNDCELHEFYYSSIKQRLTRKRNKNISYREEDEDCNEDKNMVTVTTKMHNKINKSFFSQTNNMRQNFTEIFGEHNISIASKKVMLSYDSFMGNDRCDRMRENNIKKAKKEIERDIACDLVAKYKTPLDQNTTIVPSVGVTCFKCKSDPNEMEWELLLCEYCPNGAAHCACVEPIYCSVPEGAWACDQCKEEIVSQHRVEYDHIVAAKHKELQKKYEYKYISFTKRTQTQMQPHITQQQQQAPLQLQQQPQPQQSQAQPKSFTNNAHASLFPGFFPIPSYSSQHAVTVINNNKAPLAPLPPSVVIAPPLAPAAVQQQQQQQQVPANTAAAAPQIFDQFLHALNQKTHVQNSNTGTININRLNVTNISCSNFNGGIQSTNAQQYIHSTHSAHSRHHQQHTQQQQQQQQQQRGI